MVNNMNNLNEKSRVRKGRLRAIALVITAFGLGYVLRGGGRESREDQHNNHASQEQVQASAWTCSMHPQIQQPGPGQCPLCGMDLVPVSGADDDESLGPRALKLSPRAKKLAAIEVAPIERKFVTSEIRMVGKVDYDETRIGTITAWVPGRIDRLFVDYTGIPVRKGDHMASLYSPKLLAAQEELLQALKAAKNIQDSGLSRSRETARRTVDSVREKLRLLGLTKAQIAGIEKRGTPADHVTIYAPMSGVVIHKNALEGMYVETGTKIYTIADLSHVWVRLDAYESDLAWIRYGQEVEFHSEAYPGRPFKGWIAFIDPVLDAKTRTVKVRVDVPNPEGKLKPEMFVRATVRAEVASGGAVMSSTLAGKWICPMHPGVVKDRRGSCDICGMPLERPESLGYKSVDRAAATAPLVIPASAPLITGKRAVVYVADRSEEGVYEGREVVLGLRAGDYYMVQEGLEEGELVVVNGNFKIDSAVQILAKPSMMSPEGGAPVGAHHHGGGPAEAPKDSAREISDAFLVPKAFKAQVDEVLSAYYGVHKGLSEDGLESTQAGAKELSKVLDAVDMALLDGPAHMEWMKYSGDLKKNAGNVVKAEDIGKARTVFSPLSDSLYEVIKRFGTTETEPVYRIHCPMALDGDGAYWLQTTPETENPYYGESMFRCSDSTETVIAGPTAHGKGHGHD